MFRDIQDVTFVCGCQETIGIKSGELSEIQNEINEKGMKCPKHAPDKYEAKSYNQLFGN